MAKRMKRKSIEGLASTLNEAKRSLAPLTKQLSSIAVLISEAEKTLAGYQEIADGVIVRKAKASPARRRKKPGKKKAGRPAGKKKVGGLAARLKAYRKENGLNQEAMATKLGIHVASLRTYEQGRSAPRKAALKKIERVLVGKAGKPKKARKAARKVTRKARKVTKATPKKAETPKPAPEAPKA